MSSETDLPLQTQSQFIILCITGGKYIQYILLKKKKEVAGEVIAYLADAKQSSSQDPVENVEPKP